MNDPAIVDRFWERDPTAITLSSEKYSRYVYAIAFAILHSEEDAKESENDTYLAAWNSIPPQRPSDLRSYLGKLARRLSLDKWRERTAAKRGGGQTSLCFDELSECLPDRHGLDDDIDSAIITSTLNSFLRCLPTEERNVFLRRYWYFDDIEGIAKRFGYSSTKIKSMLFRTRKKLRARLEQEDIFL